MWFTLHIMLLSMEKKLQISNSKDDVIYEQNIPWRIWKACWSQNCYWHYGEGLPDAIYYSQVCGKRLGCEKSEGDMVKNYWSSNLFSKVTQKQPGVGKSGANNSYYHLCKTVKDCLAPIKLLFFEDVAKKLNEFLVVFQADKPMAPFLTETLKDLIKTLMRKFTGKDFHMTNLVPKWQN